MLEEFSESKKSALLAGVRSSGQEMWLTLSFSLRS
jgi:hypothetical protein